MGAEGCAARFAIRQRVDQELLAVGSDVVACLVGHLRGILSGPSNLSDAHYQARPFEVMTGLADLVNASFRFGATRCRIPNVVTSA